MNISIYDPMVVDTVVRSLPPVATVFKDLFFSNVRCIEGTRVMCDFFRGSRRLAPFVSSSKESTPIEKRGYETDSFEAPLINIKDVTTAADLDIRLMGEPTFNSGYTREDRAIQHLADTLQGFNALITRREEWMCSRAILTGEIPIVGEGVRQKINFGFSNFETLTGNSRWTETGADPLKDFDRWAVSIRRHGYRQPNICIMDRDSYNAFIRNEKVMKMLDIINYNLAAINPRQMDLNLAYVGTLTSIGISIYVYDEWFVDDWTDPNNPVEKPVLEPGTVVLACTEADFRMYYGELLMSEAASKDLRSYMAPRAADSWIQKDPDGRIVRMMSRPLPVPREVDSWSVGKVF